MAETKTMPAATVPAGAKQDVVVQGKPIAGSNDGKISVTYNPGPGDPEETEVFGHKLSAGEAADIPAKHADKVRGNPYLSLKGEKTYGDDQPKDAEAEEIEETSFEENVLREREKEYLEGRTYTTNAPGEAERVARAQQAVAELRAAQESDDTDKPRRGRKKAD